MDPSAEFLFDLLGYVKIPSVLSTSEVAAANAAIDAHREEFEEAPGRSRKFEHIEGMLGWPSGERDPFVRMLGHPKLVPYLNMICGQGFRMDHGPTVLTMDRPVPGTDTEVAIGLHGSSGPHFDPSQYYIWKNGQMHNALCVVSFALCDQNAGDGGFVCVPGSHKSNLRGPPQLYLHKAESFDQFVKSYWGYAEGLTKEVTCKAGDVVVFTEALTHGTGGWNGDHQRRVCHYRYNAASMAYSGGRHPYDNEHRAGRAWPASWYNDLTDAQRAVLEPPYHGPVFTERPILTDDGDLDKQSKAIVARKGWDKIGGNLSYEDTRPRQIARQRKEKERARM